MEDLQKLLQMVNDTDELVEHAMLSRAPLVEALPRALDSLSPYIDADALAVRVMDESGNWNTYARPERAATDPDIIEMLATLEDAGEGHSVTERGEAFGQRLDMSIRYLGGVVALFRNRDPTRTEYIQKALHQWAEVIDNYVAGVRGAVVKQRALARISDALKHPVLETALDQAITELRKQVTCSSIAVVVKSDDVLERSSIAYRIVDGSQIRYSSADPARRLEDGSVRAVLNAPDALHPLLQLGIAAEVCDDAPIFGLDENQRIGRVAVGHHQRLTPFERDIIDRFADYLRQRVVDFSREWRGLSRTFAKATVERLLREPDYHQRFLSPREENVAVLFTDIAGFTTLSEEILRSPSQIGELIDRWSRQVVDIVWETGGVFDKMVGDCIIAMWGPPFYDVDEAGRCIAAIEAARQIRDITASLNADSAFPELADTDTRVDVATGVNFCPLYVGRFGPDENFTGFSSGMNNAARLQGVANAGEILCMDRVVELCGDAESFGEQRSSSVKNVAKPLCYRALT